MVAIVTDRWTKKTEIKEIPLMEHEIKTSFTKLSPIERLKQQRRDAEQTIEAIDAEIDALESTPAWEPTPGEIYEYCVAGEWYIVRRGDGIWSQRIKYTVRPLDWTTVPDAGLPKAHPSVVTQMYGEEDIFMIDVPELPVPNASGGVYGSREEAQSAADALIVRLIRGIK